MWPTVKFEHASSKNNVSFLYSCIPTFSTSNSLLVFASPELYISSYDEALRVYSAENVYHVANHFSQIRWKIMKALKN